MPLPYFMGLLLIDADENDSLRDEPVMGLRSSTGFTLSGFGRGANALVSRAGGGEGITIDTLFTL